MAIGKAYYCDCGKKYLIFIPTIRQIKIQDPKTIKNVDVSLRTGYKKELDFAKNFTQKRGLILVNGTNLEVFQCSCGCTVDVDLEMQKKIDEELKSISPIASKAPEEKGDKMESNSLINQKRHKLTKAQKIVVIVTVTLILLSEVAVLGIRYYHRNEALDLLRMGTIKQLLASDPNDPKSFKGDRALAIGMFGYMLDKRFFTLHGGSKSQLIRKLEDSSLEECRELFGKLYDGIYIKTMEKINIKNKQIFIMHSVTLTFLILGSAAFFIAKINKQG